MIHIAWPAHGGKTSYGRRTVQQRAKNRFAIVAKAPQWIAVPADEHFPRILKGATDRRLRMPWFRARWRGRRPLFEDLQLKPLLNGRASNRGLGGSGLAAPV